MANFVIAVLVGGAVFFAAQALLSVLLRRQAPRSAQVQALLAEQTSRSNPIANVEEWVRTWANSRGYHGTIVPLLMALAALYLILALLLQGFLGSQTLALVLAAPLSAVVVFFVGANLVSRRKKLFDGQLLDALVMLGGQLEAGVGINRALQQVRATSSEPLRSELGVVLQQADVTHNLVDPMSALAAKYPSRAFELFIAALRIDSEVGGRIEPALKEAADIMQRDFALMDEARAEISQAKSEFYGILIMMGLIFATVLGSGGAGGQDVYFTPSGIIMLTLVGSWVGIGILRALNVMRRANGTPPIRIRRRKSVEVAA